MSKVIEDVYAEGFALGRAADFDISVRHLAAANPLVADTWEVIYNGGERVLYGSEAAAESAVAQRIPPA